MTSTKNQAVRCYSTPPSKKHSGTSFQCAEIKTNRICVLQSSRLRCRRKTKAISCSLNMRRWRYCLKTLSKTQIWGFCTFISASDTMMSSFIRSFFQGLTTWREHISTSSRLSRISRATTNLLRTRIPTIDSN